MTTVVDASVLVAAVADAGETGRWAEDLVLNEDLVAPHLATVEATNALRRLEAHNRLTPADGDRARQHLLLLDLVLVPFAPFAERVWQLRHNLTSYDAWYVAIAEHLDSPLATLDTGLTEAAGPGCTFVAPR